MNTNSGTRYFYTDPLAAAWMAKHYGMKFGNGDNLKSACEVAATIQTKMPFYIHPNSLYLLEPQVCDLASDGNYAGLVLAASARIVTAACPERHNGKEHYCFNRDDVFIIQREKKPFHWPIWELA